MFFHNNDQYKVSLPGCIDKNGIKKILLLEGWEFTFAINMRLVYRDGTIKMEFEKCCFWKDGDSVYLFEK